MASTGTKIGIVAGILTVIGLGAKYIAPKVVALKNLTSNLFFEVGFDRIHGLVENNKVRVFIRFAIKNLSGFNLEVTNVFVKLIEIDGNGVEVSQLGYSPKKVDKISILDNKTVNGSMPVDLKMGFWLAAANPNGKFKVVTTYEFKGIQQTNETIIALGSKRVEYVAKLKKMFGLSGLQSETKSFLL